MNHNGFPLSENTRDPVEVIQMIKKLITSGKSYAALEEANEYLNSLMLPKLEKAVLEAYDKHLKEYGMDNDPSEEGFGV